MDFFTLPDPLFLIIFRYLPFKDRVRAGGVDSAFRRMSKIAISETEVLDIEEYVRRGDNFTPLAFSALMEVCAKNLQKMTFTSWSRKDDEAEKLAPVVNALLDVFGQFHCPNLRSFECWIGGGTETLRMILTNSPNLEWLFIGNITFPDTITSERLVDLIYDCTTEEGLRSLTGRFPNLELFDAGVKFESPSMMMSLDRFLATVPNLNSLTLYMYDDGLDLEEGEAMDSFWRLNGLVSLSISDQLDGISRREPSNIGDNTLIKMAESFPGLHNLRLPSDKITGRGLAALSSLQYLRVLSLRDHYKRDNDEDDWSATVVQLSKCRSLESINLPGRSLSLPALGQLYGSCRQLSRVSCWDLERFKSREQAAAKVHQSFAGIGKRRIRFTFETNQAKRNLHIWRSKPVQDALKKLHEEQGLELECRWVDE